MKYDLIISNPPYGSPGNTITKNIIENVDYGAFVNLLPCNDYRRYNKDFKLYQFVDMNTIRPIMKGFKDAAVTTMMCKVNKDRAYYISEAEFEIENYIDDSLKKYFYENRKRKHYAIDSMPGGGQTLKCAGIWDCSKTFILMLRDMNHKHLPYKKDCTTYKWNVEESIDMNYLIENHNTRDNRFFISQCVFNTSQEKRNFVNFVYSPDGFRFISKLFTAVNCDGTIKMHVLPKVDWTRPQTVQTILNDYGYTPSEIEEVVADLANFKGMEKKGMRYDVIIANPPYGKIGNEITKAVVDNIDYGVFVNLLPANDYRRFHKEDALWQYVDINSMRSVVDGFKDAYVTTMMCKVNKERALYISETEFEIENYSDKSLKKYFYENAKRNHYAIDNYIHKPTFAEFDKMEICKTFYIGYRDPKSNHLPYSQKSITTRYNLNQVTKEQVIEESAQSEQVRGFVGQFYIVDFKTKQEKDNVSNFIYSEIGFRFISKVFSALNIDGGIMLNKWFPKVNWEKPQTVQTILNDYGYTPSEIDDIIDDLKNYKYMNEAK